MLLDSPNVNGIQEVVGSTPISSTSITHKSENGYKDFEGHLRGKTKNDCIESRECR